VTDDASEMPTDNANHQTSNAYVVPVVCSAVGAALLLLCFFYRSFLYSMLFSSKGIGKKIASVSPAAATTPAASTDLVSSIVDCEVGGSAPNTLTTKHLTGLKSTVEVAPAVAATVAPNSVPYVRKVGAVRPVAAVPTAAAAAAAASPASASAVVVAIKHNAPKPPSSMSDYSLSSESEDGHSEYETESDAEGTSNMLGEGDIDDDSADVNDNDNEEEKDEEEEEDDDDDDDDFEDDEEENED
jgi:hypothetical protein